MFLADSRPQIARASQFLAQGRVAEAEAEAQAALAALGYKCGEALFLMGLVRTEQQKLEEAAALMEKALPLLPPQAATVFAYGRVLVLMGQPEQAIAQFAQTVRLQPAMVEAWYVMASQQVQLGRFAEAEKNFRRVLQLVPGHGETSMALGATVLEQGRAAEAETILREALRASHHPVVGAGIAHNLALTQTKQGKHEAALSSIAYAERLNPRKKLHGLKAEILAEMHRFDEALAVMRLELAESPADPDLHKTYNDLLYLLGREKDPEFLASYDVAPQDQTLRNAKARFLLMARRDDEAHGIFAALLAQNPAHEQAALGAANALDMMARHDEAAAVLEQARIHNPDNPALYNALAATALFQNDPQKAAAMAQKAVDIDPHYQHALANLGTAWRLLQDERDETLNGYDRFIRVFDLEPPDGFSGMADFNAELVGELEKLHPPTREFLDQSLRGGTQTRSELFGAHHVLVEKLKRRIDEAVQRYIAELQGDAAHPLLARRNKGFAYSGSWSSRLSDCGFHVNHIHPQGWISSCYYAGVPDAVEDEDAKQGWIKFGEPRFGHGLTFRHALKPRPGRLVLFPSYMWHGTIEFHAPTPRTTIAFDVVPRP